MKLSRKAISKFIRGNFGETGWEFLKNIYKWKIERKWRQEHRDIGCKIDRRINFRSEVFGYDRIHLSERVILERDVTLWISNNSGENAVLTIGPRTFVGQNTYIGVFQPINIGNQVLIGAYCYIISANHQYARRDVPIADQGFEGKPIDIEDGVWLGTQVVVLPGVRIGQGAIVAAGSVVSKDIPAWEIWGGVPARFLKVRP